ncbi:MAG: zinc-binding dehydrogenase [Acidimicrobiales bacterium]
MRAAVLREGRMIVRDDVPEPVPELGQVLVQVKACGICGSDLHFAKHGGTMLELFKVMKGLPEMVRPRTELARDVFMGHEFAAEVLEVGPGTEAPAPGTLVTSVPVMLTMTGIQDLAYSNDFPAGYSERMLLSAPLLQTVPNGLEASLAALTEPLAVGVHAVNRSGISAGEAALVVGCGPVGLAVTAALRHRGVEPVIASDFSPARRQLGSAMGAHRVVDPAVEDPWDACTEPAGGRQLVVFEAVGVPGILDELFRSAPPKARIVVVGVCMQTDHVNPFFGIAKELNVQFVLGYDPEEFAGSLRSIAEGVIDVSPMVTSTVGLDEIPAAFERLSRPEADCKILALP